MHATAWLLSLSLTLPRRAAVLALSTGVPALQSASARPAISATANVPARFSFELSSVDVGGASVPLAIWTPGGAAGRPETYPYAVDVGKIAAKLRVGWLSWLPRFDKPLPCGAAPWAGLPSGFDSSAKSGDAIVFAHGFLGSPYDMAHICEALAADGFTVAAPELPESLTASYREPEGGLAREEIISAARETVGGALRWGIFGHSAGAGSALRQRGSYALGRCALAGGYRGFDGPDPIFLIASDGDGCNRFASYPLQTILAAESDNGIAATTMFASAAAAYERPSGGRMPLRGAYIFSEAAAGGAPLPCHISFLWSASNEALIALLAPLLPVAQALGLFVLDFDVYMANRDSEATAEQVAPAVRRFFLSASQRR